MRAFIIIILFNLLTVASATGQTKIDQMLDKMSMVGEVTYSSIVKRNKNTKKKEDNGVTYRIFSFQNINDISKAAVILAPIYNDSNSLYKSPNDNLYYLIVNNQSNNLENYQKVCNLLSEYGTKVKANYAMPYYFAEHYQLIIQNDAIQTLASI